MLPDKNQKRREFKFHERHPGFPYVLGSALSASGLSLLLGRNKKMKTIGAVAPLVASIPAMMAGPKILAGMEWIQSLVNTMTPILARNRSAKPLLITQGLSPLVGLMTGGVQYSLGEEARRGKKRVTKSWAEKGSRKKTAAAAELLYHYFNQGW